MPRVLLKSIGFLFLILIFNFPFWSQAQDTISQKSPLINYLQKLENDFDIKFSYVDEALQTIQIKIPQQTILNEIITEIETQTQLEISKLSERYYSLIKSNTLDICGQVLDNFQDNTIAGATVEVIGSKTAIITDSDGIFYLKNIPRKAIIRIRYLGYKVKYLSAEELAKVSPCTTILMAQGFQELDEVVVYQFLTSGLVKKQDASIQLSVADFGILPGLIEPDVLQTIQALPGIKSIDETVSDINVRGGTNDQNLILWDGIKMYQSGHFFGLISAFNPYLVDKVNIIKNGTSAQYGDGVSSVISMETKNTISDTFFGGAGFNFISGDAYGQIPLSKKLAFQFSGRRSTTDFLNTPTYNSFFDRAFQDSEIKENDNQVENIERNENFYFYDFTGKLLYDINENHNVRVSFININNNLDYIETNTDNSSTSKSQLSQKNISFGGSLESNWTGNFSTSLNLYYTNYNLDAQNNFEDVQQLFQNNRILETAVKLSTNYQFSGSLSWLNGYQFNEVGITNFTNVTQPPFNSNIKGVIRTHALFSELGYESLDTKLTVHIGARFNAIENLNTFKEFIVEPRININYALTKSLYASVQGEFKNQSTNQIIDLKQNFLGIEKRRWMLSDGETLPITKSKQASMSFNYDKQHLYIGIEGFYKNVDGISTETQGFQNQDQFNGEIGSYEVKGVELLINKRTPKLSTWLSYAYNLNTYTFEDINPNRFPNNLDIRHTITFASTYTYNKLKLGGGINYRTGKPFTKPVDGTNAINTTFFPNTINFESPNSSRIADYLRVDASAIYDFDLSPKIKATIGASVLNLLGRKNILNTYYRLDDSNQIETVENISLGITPNINCRIQF